MLLGYRLDQTWLWTAFRVIAGVVEEDLIGRSFYTASRCGYARCVNSTFVTDELPF